MQKLFYYIFLSVKVTCFTWILGVVKERKGTILLVKSFKACIPLSLFASALMGHTYTPSKKCVVIYTGPALYVEVRVIQYTLQSI